MVQQMLAFFNVCNFAWLYLSLFKCLTFGLLWFVSLRWKQRKLFAKQLSWFVSLYQGCQIFLHTLNRYLPNARVKYDLFILCLYILGWIQEVREEGSRNGLSKTVSCWREGGGSSYPRKLLKFKILRNGISIILRPNQHVTNLISFFYWGGFTES